VRAPGRFPRPEGQARRLAGVRADEEFDVIVTGTRKDWWIGCFDRCFEGEVVNFAGWFNQAIGRRYLAVTYSPLRPTSERVEAAIVRGANSSLLLVGLTDPATAAQHFARIGVGSVNPTTLARASLGSLRGGSSVALLVSSRKIG